jgi:hypothetical protein
MGLQACQFAFDGSGVPISRLHNFIAIDTTKIMCKLPQIESGISSPVVLLNAPVLTSDGKYSMQTCSVVEAARLVRTRGFESAIGHAQTAAIISSLLQINCPPQRIEVRQQPGESALVFRLKRRLEEGRVLQSTEEVEQVGYSFAVLERLE